MHSFTKVMLIAYIFTTQWIYGEKKHDSGFFKFLWWSNWAWELRSCEQTNTEKFEGSGSIHPSSYEFRQSRRQKAFLTFVYELETHYSDGQRVLFGCWVVFFFYHKKGMLFSSNWQKHTPKSHGIISRSAKHVAICKAPQPPPCPHNGSASAWSSHSISAGSSTFSHHCFKTMEKSFQPGLLYRDLQCCSGLVGRECHEFFSIF